MTRRGIAAAVLAALCLGLGLYTGARELYMLAIIPACALALAYVQVRLARPRLSVWVGAGTGARGVRIPVGVEAYNPGPLPVVPLKVTLSLRREGMSDVVLLDTVAALGVGGRRVFEAEALCPHRGAYSLRLEAAQRRDLFGFFALAGAETPPGSLLVLSRIATGGAPEGPDSGREDDSQPGRARRAGLLSAESRLYVPGDALRAIHWKKSAALGVLHTRLRERTASGRCALLVDTAPRLTGEAALEYEDSLCESALAVLFGLLAEGRAVTLLPGPLDLTLPEQLTGAARLMAALVFTEGGTEAALQGLLDAPDKPDTLFVVSAGLSHRSDALLAALEGRGAAAVCLCPHGYVPEGTRAFAMLPEVAL